MWFILKSAVFLMLFYSVFVSMTPDNEYSTKKFRVIEEKLNWHGALLACNSQEMTLATIESRQEQDQLQEYLKTYSGTNGYNRRWWLGGADLHKDREFVWFSTGKDMNYTNFYEREPTHKFDGDQEHCLELRGDVDWNYKWNDKPCSYNLHFICEYFP